MKKTHIWLILLILFLPLSVYAKKDSFTLKCDNEKYKVGDKIVCRVTVDSKFKYNNIVFKINTSSGLLLEDVRSNYSSYWKVEFDKNQVKSTAKSLSNTNKQEFAILLLTITEEGDQTINISDIVLSNLEDKSTKKLDSIENKLHILSDNNLLKSIKINDDLITEFNPALKEYTIKINDEEEINIEGIPQNIKSIIKNGGKHVLNKKENNIVIPITITSESSINSIYTLKFIRENFNENTIDKTLKNIEITANKKIVNFKFNPNIYSYEILLDDNIKKLTIDPTRSNKNTSFIKKFGKQNIVINEGDNLVLIKIKDSEGEILTYTIYLKKAIKDKSANAYLKSINIKGTSIDFYKKVKNYTIYIKPNTKELDIDALTEHKRANIVIQGNKDIKEGSIVKIQVTAENGNKTIYNIKVMYKEINYLFLIIPIIGAAILGTFVIIERKKIFVSHKIKKDTKIEPARTKKSKGKITQVKTTKKTTEKNNKKPGVNKNPKLKKNNKNIKKKSNKKRK